MTLWVVVSGVVGVPLLACFLWIRSVRRGETDEAQRRLVDLLAEQLADTEQADDAVIRDNLNI